MKESRSSFSALASARLLVIVIIASLIGVSVTATALMRSERNREGDNGNPSVRPNRANAEPGRETFAHTAQQNAPVVPFTPGNLVIYRVGDGSAALSSNATPVFLDEYTQSGTLVQSIPMPTSVIGSNKRLTASGTATSEGLLTCGTPTTSGQTITNLPGFPMSTGSPYSFFFAHLKPSVDGGAGIDTVYVADDNATGTGGIQKFSLVAGSWVSNGTIASTAGLRGLTGFALGPELGLSSTSVTLFATTSNVLFTLTDTSGYNATITGVLTPLTPASTNTNFRGVAFAPASPGAFSFTTIDFPGTTDTGIGGINSLGNIVGGYTLPDATRHGFLDVGGTFTTIDDPTRPSGERPATLTVPARL